VHGRRVLRCDHRRYTSKVKLTTPLAKSYLLFFRRNERGHSRQSNWQRFDFIVPRARYNNMGNKTCARRVIIIIYRAYYVNSKTIVVL